MRLWYKRDGSNTTLSCTYRKQSNSGGGGGGGQVWIGEINVTPGEKLNFTIGNGGSGATSYGANGSNGGETNISKSNGTKIAYIPGGNGGGYTSNTDNTSLLNTRGMGRGLNTTNNGNLAIFNKWTGINYSTDPRHGGPATLPTSGGGGAGGQSIAMNGTILNGGSASGAHARGNDAPSTNYGAGGSGGGGVTQEGRLPGLGGNGANGYIYLEWGKTNGGGGASGQIITEYNIDVAYRDIVKINVGNGGSAKPILNNPNGTEGQYGQKGNNGADSYITTPDGDIVARAKGGEGGDPGSTTHGNGGNYSNGMLNSAKGGNGTNTTGGSGGSSETLPELAAFFPLLEELKGKGVGGCGGNMSGTSLTCANPSSTPVGKQGNSAGAGGGGGAVSGNNANIGGNGASGMVIIEYTVQPR